PFRFWSLHGGARAAVLSGDRAKAEAYYAMLVGQTASADVQQYPHLKVARAFLEKEEPPLFVFSERAGIVCSISIPPNEGPPARLANKCQRRLTMTDQRPKTAALLADAFQEEEYFFPKVALNEAGYQVEVVSSRKQPVEMYSYFARTGLLDVERAIADARPEEYMGVVIPVGAKSHGLLDEDPRVAKFGQH